MLRRTPDGDSETLFFFFRVSSFETREDIKTWMDLIDRDDLVTFGGKP